jgi:hypothetical protein
MTGWPHSLDMEGYLSMSVGILTHRFSVAARPGEIAAYMTDPANYGELNPFVISVGGASEGDEGVEFTAVERIRLFGPIHQRNPLRLVARSEGPVDRVIYDITARGGIVVRIVTELTELGEAGGGTDVRDMITLTVPRVARGFAMRQARFAQHHKAAVLGRLAPVPDAG